MRTRIEVTAEFKDSLQTIKNLFHACNWDWPADSLMSEAFSRSHKVFLAYSGADLVGFARIISDGRTYGLLVDLMVAPESRQKGVGSLLVKRIKEDSKNDGLKVIQLLASKEGRALYAKMGFQPCPDAAPGMILFL